MSSPITICEVGPRDGLQNERTLLPPSSRADLCARLLSTGVGRLEAVSFVHPRLVPAMADAEMVLAGFSAPDEAEITGLVLNGRGLERALSAGLRSINVAYPISNSFCERNQNMSLDRAADETTSIVARARESGASVTVTLAAAFGCPFEGEVDPGLVIEHAGRAAAAQADAIVLADTIGVGVPTQVRQLLTGAAATTNGATTLGLHLHNTRNTGYANAVTGLEHGATLFDSSVGGIGGCPFAPRATGNIATEDLVYLLERSGVSTGIDLDAMISTAHWLSQKLGYEVPGLLQRAGSFP